jgi:hypothetical protein
VPTLCTRRELATGAADALEGTPSDARTVASAAPATKERVLNIDLLHR